MSAYRKVWMMTLLWCLAIGSAWASSGLFSWGRETEFLEATEVFKLGEVRQDTDGMVIAGQVADGYYVYRHSLKLTDAQSQPLALDLPQGLAKHDEFFGDTEIFTADSLELRLPATASGAATLHWQGCAEAGICYPPQTIAVNLPATQAAVRAVPAQPSRSGDAAQPERETQPPQAANSTTMQANDSEQASGASSNTTTPLPAVQAGAAVAEDQAAAQRLASLGPVMGTLLFFGFGLLLAFTPCTLPMIPIVSTMVVGSRASPRRAFVLSLAYILAMAGTYAAVGVAAGLAGANLQAALQSPWLLGAFAALFLILASSLFGLFELQLPAALVNRVESAGRGRAGGSVGGAAALGLLSALLVGPCMTAPLAGALLYIGQTGSALQGGLALFALGLGMGLPLLVIAVFGARVLPKPGAWMERVRVAFGYVMVGMAITMLARFLPGTVSLMLWGAWGVAVSVGLIAWAQALVERQRAAWTLRFGATFAGIWSVLMLVGAASGADSVLQPLAHLRGTAPAVATATPSLSYVAAKSVEDVDARLAEAGARGEWTLIDFYADWCVSCHVIERNVFGDAVVAQRLAHMQVVRPDVTRNDALDQALLKRWGVMGPPTLILVGPDGSERRDLRVVGEIDAPAFLARLDAAGTP